MQTVEDGTVWVGFKVLGRGRFRVTKAVVVTEEGYKVVDPRRYQGATRAVSVHGIPAEFRDISKKGALMEYGLEIPAEYVVALVHVEKDETGKYHETADGGTLKKTRVVIEEEEGKFIAKYSVLKEVLELPNGDTVVVGIFKRFMGKKLKDGARPELNVDVINDRITGDTFFVKDDLRAMGFRWEPSVKAWIPKRGTITDDVIERLREIADVKVVGGMAE